MQENMPVTPEEVCSRAMVLCGMEPMASFAEQGRDEVIVASQLYELLVMGALSSYPWAFASGEQQLELSAADPLDRYETAWHMPTIDSGTPLQIQRLTVDDMAINYDIVGNLLYTRADAASVVIASYQYRIAEAYWLPQFTLYFLYELAATFARAVTRNSKQIASFEQMSALQFARAKTRDSQSRSAKRVVMGGLRRGISRGLPGNIAQ